jgi:hypothetical protein
MNARILPACDSPEMGDLIAAYSEGRLSEAEAAPFEDHFLGCARCSEVAAVALQLLVTPLARSFAPALSLEPRASAGDRRPQRAAGWTALAASMGAIGLGLWIARGPLSSSRPGSSMPAPVSSEHSKASANAEALPTPGALPAPDLPVPDLPVYEPLVLRGPDIQPDPTRRALDLYARGRFREAAAGLSALSSPRTERTDLFLGAAHLGAGDPAAARVVLERLVLTGGEYEDEARFLLAQAALRTADRERAVALLRTVRDAKGERSQAAARILATLGVS